LAPSDRLALIVPLEACPPKATRSAILLPNSSVSHARHIPSLDGLRAVSFLFVFVAHAGLENLVPGGFGVTVFFFLSGLLITTLMRAEYDKNGSVSFRHFWLRRALRILPPFYVVLALATIASLILDPPGTLSRQPVAAQALHYSNYWLVFHGYGGQAPGTDVYWSLAVEEHFYLLFPLLYVGLRRLNVPPRHQALLLWGICALIAAWRTVLVLVYHAPTIRTYLASDTRIDSILFGCALAVYGNPVLDRWPLAERTWKYTVLPLATAVLVGCLVYRAPAFRETVRYSLQGLALTAIFIGAIRWYDWAPFWLLNTRPVAFLGVLSYSLYLVHYVVLSEFARHLPSLSTLLRALLSFAVSFALAWAIYKFIETPCARLRKRLTD
jgi:peptidoglycan/LPS O-acetylase OafA/YrhL